MTVVLRRGLIVIKNNLILLFFIFNLILFNSTYAQDLKPTNNKGGYTFDHFTKQDSKNGNDIVISGKVFDLKTKETIEEVTIKFGCKKIKVDKNGEYIFDLKPNDLEKNYLNAIGLGYKPIETEYFPLKPKDSIIINFYLSEDDKPLIDCPPKKD